MTQTVTMTLTEFLTARLNDDVCDVGSLECPCDLAYDGTHAAICPDRVLADVKAKRAIVEACTIAVGEVREKVAPGRYNVRPQLVPLDEMGGDIVLAHLASVYADHPDFDEAWRA